MALKILGGLLALGIGVWLGMPGRYRPDYQEIDRVMSSGTGRRKKVKRRFTAIAWLQRQVSPRSPSRGPRTRRGFRVESPDDR